MASAIIEYRLILYMVQSILTPKYVRSLYTEAMDSCELWLRAISNQTTQLGDRVSSN